MSDADAATNGSRFHESWQPISSSVDKGIMDSSLALSSRLESTTCTTEKHLSLIGEDIPWIVKYVRANKEEAFLCLLFSLVAGLCCILLAILICVCYRWRQARSKGSFTIVKSNNEVGGGQKGAVSHIPGGAKETESLLNPTVSHNAASGRTYSPRLIRAEYARGISGGSAPPSSTNANVVGLYLSQAPKSRWSRASDAIVWPIPPNSLAPGVNATVEGNMPSVSTVSRTLPIQEQVVLDDSGRNIAFGDSPFMPSLSVLLSQNKQKEQRQPQSTYPSHIPVQSSFVPASSPTDYLFNRQSPAANPLLASGPFGAAPVQPSSLAPDPLLRKPLTDETLMQRKAMSYHAPNAPAANLAFQQQQHHRSYAGPSHPTSPPVLPAPATSPWPARASQIDLDETEVAGASYANEYK